MFLVLRDKQSTPVFLLQCSYLQLSVNILECLAEHGRRKSLRALLILRILLLLLLFCPHQNMSEWMSKECPRNLSGPITILPLSTLKHLWLLTLPSDNQGSNCVLMFTTPCTDKLTEHTHYPEGGRKSRTNTKRGNMTYSRLLSKWVAELGLELWSPLWCLSALSTKLHLFLFEGFILKQGVLAKKSVLDSFSFSCLRGFSTLWEAARQPLQLPYPLASHWVQSIERPDRK